MSKIKIRLKKDVTINQLMDALYYTIIADEDEVCAFEHLQHGVDFTRDSVALRIDYLYKFMTTSRFVDKEHWDLFEEFESKED